MEWQPSLGVQRFVEVAARHRNGPVVCLGSRLSKVSGVCSRCLWSGVLWKWLHSITIADLCALLAD